MKLPFQFYIVLRQQISYGFPFPIGNRLVSTGLKQQVDTFRVVWYVGVIRTFQPVNSPEKRIGLKIDASLIDFGSGLDQPPHHGWSSAPRSPVQCRTAVTTWMIDAGTVVDVQSSHLISMQTSSGNQWTILFFDQAVAINVRPVLQKYRCQFNGFFFRIIFRNTPSQIRCSGCAFVVFTSS
ncbi:hypothetical protein LX87_02993 [Larkinella arboricola]|uniref:Uncharacterized protein n=1 Tax=Larkinella arboricola TaxID=643671 RepID=A0A327X0E1_LARAB|nr:hypothetical protein LX87_02993 [Larkinella arboricola]